MSTECMGLVARCYIADSMAEWALAMMLAEAADHDGTSIYPSVDTVAELAAQQNKRTAQRGLRKMLDSEWLQLVRPATNRRPAEYRINPDWLDAAHAALARRIRGGKHKQVRMPVPAPREIRGDTMPPQENDAGRGDTMPPQAGGAGVTPATARGDIDDTAYIRDPSKTHPPNPPQGADGFDALLTAYPLHRCNVKAARRAWHKLKPDAMLQGWILAAAKAQAGSPRWTANEGERVPNLSKWLANEGWRSTPKPGAPAAQTAATKDQGAPAPRLTKEQLQENGRKAREVIAKARALIQSKAAEEANA